MITSDAVGVLLAVVAANGEIDEETAEEVEDEEEELEVDDDDDDEEEEEDDWSWCSIFMLQTTRTFASALGDRTSSFRRNQANASSKDVTLTN
jgi:hypothetical protein